MAKYKYSYIEKESEKVSKASASNLSISLKKSVEVANAIRGKKASFAISYLEKVVDKKVAVPYRRYNAELAHQKGKGISTGGFPVSVSNSFIQLLKSAVKNAGDKELDGELYIKAISARKGASRHHFGRMPGRKMKSTHLEVILAPRPKKAAKKESAKTAASEVTKK